MAGKCQSEKNENCLPKKIDIMAQNIYDWAINEMNYKESGLLMPSMNDLKELCIGPMMDIFPFIVKNVKSKQSVKTIRGNVRLQPGILEKDSNGQESVHSTIKVLDSKKSDLKLKIKDKIKMLVLLKKEVNDKTTESIIKEETQDQLMKALDDVKKREITLEAQSLKTREKTEDLWRYEALLGDILERCEQRRNFKATTFVEKDGNIVSVCMQDVKDSCKTIEESIGHQIDSYVIDNQVWIPDGKILETVKESIGSHDELEIMDYLVESTKNSFKCESDVPDDSQLQFSSDLQIQKISQIHMFVKTKESQIKTHCVNNQRMELVKSIERKLVEIYNNDDNSLNITRQVIEGTVEEGKLRGQIEYLKKESLLLDEKLSYLEEKCKSLNETSDSIFLEEAKLKKKQEDIVLLSRSFKKEITMFDTKQQEVNEIVTKSFERSKLDELCNHIRLLRDSTAIDVDSLLTLPLNDTIDTKSAVGRKDLVLLSEIAKLKENLRRKQQLLDSQTYMMNSIASCEGGFDSDRISALSESVSKLKLEKMELLLFTIQSFLKTTTERISDTQKIKETVKNWWEQPSQNIDLGLTVDNKSVKEWIS